MPAAAVGRGSFSSAFELLISAKEGFFDGGAALLAVPSVGALSPGAKLGLGRDELDDGSGGSDGSGRGEGARGRFLLSAASLLGAARFLKEDFATGAIARLGTGATGCTGGGRGGNSSTLGASAVSSILCCSGSDLRLGLRLSPDGKRGGEILSLPGGGCRVLDGLRNTLGSLPLGDLGRLSLLLLEE